MLSISASSTLLFILLWRPATVTGVGDPVSSRTCSFTFNVDREDGCGVTDGTVTQLLTIVDELHSQVSSLLEQKTNLPGGFGAAYTRWGRTVCPDKSSLVYSGYAAGSFYTHTGGSSELICLPERPQWGRYVDGFQGESFIYGTEYETRWRYGANDVFLKNNIDGQSLNNHNVPCAVCYTDGRSTAMRFPAMLQCPGGWSEEYHGYLMAGYFSHKGKMQPVCLDEAPEAAESGLRDENGALFYNMEAKCGSLPCPNYINGRELTCVVCSR